MIMKKILSNPEQNRKEMIFVPPMDSFCSPLLVAVLRSAGYDSRLLSEDAKTLAMGLKHTSGGECAPCPLTLGSLMTEIQEKQLSPEQVVFFMPTACGPCRFGQYAKLTAMILEKTGWGAVRIMSPSSDNSYAGLDSDLRMRIWHAMLIGDILRKLGMKIRPYEQDKGETDSITESALKAMIRIFEKPDISQASGQLAKTIDALGRVKQVRQTRPLIGVVGEIYVRCDSFINGNVCRRIEEMGGEAWLAPIAEWVLYTSYIKGILLKTAPDMGALVKRLRAWLEHRFFFEKWEHHYYGIAEPLLFDRKEHSIADVVETGASYLPRQFEGESILTLGRGELFVTRDKASALVNVGPMFCMPGTITSSIFPKIERKHKIPVVSLFYDGSGDPNQRLVPVMHYICRNHAQNSVQVNSSR